MENKTALKKIGARIKKLRLEKKYTQQTFSEAVGISTQYLSCIERGKSNPNMDKFILIINTLGCTADDLFFDVIDTGTKIKASLLSEKIAALPVSEQKKILAMVETFVDFSDK